MVRLSAAADIGEQPFLPDVLTPREREIAALIARGYSNRSIADELVIATGTAERHVANILAKLNMRSRAEVAAWASRDTPLKRSWWASNGSMLTPGVRTNLPQELSTFVGRGREIRELSELLPTTRLLTLTGPAGIGKTRLALRLAGDAESRSRNLKNPGGVGRVAPRLAESVIDAYANGVWLVELAPVQDGALIPQTLARVLGVRELSTEPLLVTVRDALRDCRLLLILDNCEHVIQGVAELANMLLQSCSDLRILATSREALGIIGESSWQVPPLEVARAPEPSMDLANQPEAVRLFVERGHAVDRSFKLTEQNAESVAQLCIRLEGIPLALELAAAHVRLFSPEQIVVRLDQYIDLPARVARIAPARHQSLRAAVEWSYDLLEEPEKSLFVRLAVFTGGWTLEAAEAVCAGAGIDARHIVGLLDALLGKSLIETQRNIDGEPRYRFLDVIRRYAAERLAASAEDPELYRRHADWYQALAVEGESHLFGPRSHHWLRKLELERDNVRTALRWLVDSGDIEAALQLAASFWRFWSRLGYASEGLSWARRLLELPSNTSPRLRMKLLAAAAMLSARGLNETSLRTAEGFVAEALALGRECGTCPELAHTLFMCGSVARLRCQFDTATTFLKQALEACLATGWSNETGCRVGLASVAYAQGRFDEAREWIRAAQASASARGHRSGFGLALRNMGAVSYQQGDFAAARTYIEQSLDLIVDPLDRCMSLIYLGWVARDTGSPPEAWDAFTKAMTLARNAGDLRQMAYCLESFAGLAAGAQQPARAMRLAAAANALRQRIGTPIFPVEGATLERWLAPARATLRPTDAESIWADGAALSMEQACEDALALESCVEPPPDCPDQTLLHPPILPSRVDPCFMPQE
jgi:non-specific serine/threonine protein kinase